MHRSPWMLLLSAWIAGCFPVLPLERDKAAADPCIGYPDRDGDGFGDASMPTDYDCDQQPEVLLLDSSDCDDGYAAVNPAAVESCDSIDNDCDGEVDEAGAQGGGTWYTDADGDGYGDATAEVTGCTQPVGAVSDTTDCDDSSAQVYPGASERCNDIDDDCDGPVDEDLIYTWYADVDGDSFGNAASTLDTCDPPGGWVSDTTDCDDDRSDVYPGAPETCDGADQDCDDEVDENASDAPTWYRDADGDGFGVSSTTVDDCDEPAGYTDNADDCDDARSAVNPDASEVCNLRDDDCDGLVDDDDPSLDTSGLKTFYADADADGYGDPAVSVSACDAPSGYVDNAEDCDDTDPLDTDGDGLQDCEDDDIDGDGLRNDWDADPYDDSVVRGPSAGSGADGAGTISSDVTWEDWTVLATGTAAGATQITVDDTSLFSDGDEVLVLSQQGTDAGQYQFAFVTSVSSTRLKLEPPLDKAYSSSSVVLVQRVPQYTDLTVSGYLSASDWAGSGGGVFVARATGTISVSGAIDASAMGFRGGAGVTGNTYDPYQGESYGGTGGAGDSTNNDGGGGAHEGREDHMDSGGGGAYGTDGKDGSDHNGASVTDGGLSYGVSTLTTWFFGSGGGGGAPDTESDGNSKYNASGDGGDGGGLIALLAGTSITVAGEVLADGADGEDAVIWRAEAGGGGGGGGGQILLAAPTITIAGTVSAAGGAGGLGDSDSASWSSEGGEGGDGRIRLEYTTLSGTTTPTAGSTGSWSP